MSAVIPLMLALASSADAQACTAVASAASSVRVEYDSRVSALGHASPLIFAPSSDGELQAFDADSGAVLWSFRAPELLTASATTGLITDLAVLRFDANGDGVIDRRGGDRVWLYFGLKRAGAHYYALDVTARTPRVLWTAGSDTLEGLAEAWSTPTVARVRVAGVSQNGEEFVIVIGGGFSADSSAAGNRVFMLDAASGHLLWSAGADGSSDLTLSHMTHGIAARVAVLDVDGDGFADRMYTADTGGRVWRFDIWNGRSRDQLVTGGVLASLGTAEPLPLPPAPSDARAFFVAPDVALVQSRGGSAWYGLALGSGEVTPSLIRNRFYSLRDREPFSKRSQSDYDAASPVLDADLVDVTAGTASAQVPDDAAGWKMDLPSAGEGVLAEAVTANGVVMFTTHTSGATVDGSACEAGASNRVYAVRLDTGGAALDLNHDTEVTEEDRSAVLAQTGVAPGVRIELPARDATVNPSEPGSPAVPVPASRCTVGTELLSQCVTLPLSIRTFWKRDAVD